ncbi:Kynurenine formamidase [Ruminococcaceae bacterium FB2012]|nr:Kynurenine formamidase [Ruminococcaceae bacterium FB2012]
MLYDISQEVFSCTVFPGDPKPEKKTLMSVSKGDVCNLTGLSMCAHNGTHVDAPYHFLNDGKTIDQVGLEPFIGDCFVVRHEGNVSAEDAESFLKRAEEAGAGERLLIGGKATVTAEAAKVFAARGLLLIGNESQTVGPEDAPMEVHLILLGAGTVLLEGIRLEGIPEGKYLLMAQPLNLGGCDGSPCRAVLQGRAPGPSADGATPPQATECRKTDSDAAGPNKAVNQTSGAIKSANPNAKRVKSFGQAFSKGLRVKGRALAGRGTESHSARKRRPRRCTKKTVGRESRPTALFFVDEPYSAPEKLTSCTRRKQQGSEATARISVP